MSSYISLLSACYAGINNPSFLPSEGTTFCNEFVDSVAKGMLCNDFTGMMANDIIDYMSASNSWTLTAIDKVQSLASVGSLVIAGRKDNPHGHVCVIVPGNVVYSPHWKMNVPVCANVGETVFIGKGISFAFREPPDFYLWRPSL